MRVGDVLDGVYRLIEKIGEGGFGTVWRALDCGLEREVAVKVISGRGGVEPKDIERFKAEARTVASLAHPHIVTVHAQRETVLDGTRWHYLVMELVTGRSLAQELRRGRPAPAVGYGWLAQVCEALHASHQAGVVHRDIKPENVMVTAAGEVKVLDFGIAALEGRTLGFTTTGSVIGSPYYLPPERWRGEPGKRQVDLYAVGCLLYELSVGARAFAGPDAVAVMHAHVEGPVPSPRAADPALPPELDRLVTELLAKDPADRPADAAQVRERLLGLAELAGLRELRRRADAAWALGEAGEPGRAVARLRPLVGEFAAVYGVRDPRTVRTAHDLALWLAADGEQAAAVGLLRELAQLAPGAEGLVADRDRLAGELPAGATVPTGELAALAAVKRAGA